VSSAAAVSRKAYFVEHMNGSYTQRFWSTTNPPVWVNGFVGRAARLQAHAYNSENNTAFGESQAIYAPVKYAHAGWIAGSGTGCCDGNGKHEETWYRFRLRFPGGGLFKPNPGAMSIFQAHVDDKTAADAQTHGGNAYSNVLQVKTDGGGCNGVCTTPGTNPRLVLRVIGGATSQADVYGAANATYFRMRSNSLRYDRWYDIVIHLVLGESTNGYVQWWVDGHKFADAHVPTQYVRSDGTFSYGENLEFMNYRQVASWDSAVDFDEFIIGRTAASVGFKT
jgi:hypothetical protein